MLRSRGAFANVLSECPGVFISKCQHLGARVGQREVLVGGSRIGVLRRLECSGSCGLQRAVRRFKLRKVTRRPGSQGLLDHLNPLSDLKRLPLEIPPQRLSPLHIAAKTIGFCLVVRLCAKSYEQGCLKGLLVPEQQIAGFIEGQYKML